MGRATDHCRESLVELMERAGYPQKGSNPPGSFTRMARTDRLSFYPRAGRVSDRRTADDPSR